MRCEVVSSPANSLTKQKYFRLCAPMVNRTKKKSIDVNPTTTSQLIHNCPLGNSGIFFVFKEVVLYAYGLTTVPQSG